MSKKPNFIVIHTDQHRYDCTGIAGRRTGIYTPYIDSIAYQGANFTSAYTDCPLCIPQRLSLLTGQTPAHHGLFANVGIPYLPLETTLPAEMRRGGYQTALVGRTMHTYPFNYSYGFEYYMPGDPSSDQKDKGDAFFRDLKEHSSKEAGGYYGCGPHNNSRAAAPYHLPDELHQSKWATNRALEFLENRDQSRPYMLFVGYYAPHSPHNPPAEFFDRYYQRNDLGHPYISSWDIPPVSAGNVMARYTRMTDEDKRCLYAGYYGNIAFLDTQVARLLQAAMDKNTYVIFTSDHGEMLGDHYLMQKNRPYEGAVHIPFMIMGPEISDGQQIDCPIGWTDIMPTILDFAGLTIPDSVDGRSLAPMLCGADRTPVRVYMHGECTHDFMFDAKIRPQSDCHNFLYEKGSQFLTDGKMKYIWYVTSGREQLFDVENDFAEAQDLSENPAYAQEVRLWRKRMAKELAGRPEGFSDGTNLFAGMEPRRTDARMTELMRQRQSEGFSLAFAQKACPEEKMVFAEHLCC